MQYLLHLDAYVLQIIDVSFTVSEIYDVGK
jgi:hypothetical protein